MKPLKPDQLRRMSLQDLERELDNQRTELYRLRVQKTVAQLKNTDALRIVRRNIARLETLIKEKARGVNA